jgi:hypothetical protein
LEVKLSDKDMNNQRGSTNDDHDNRVPVSPKPISDDNEEFEVPGVDLSSLTSEQQQQAKEMLCQEADAFAQDEEDVGCIEQLQMNSYK